jgi:hypothetical protein
MPFSSVKTRKNGSIIQSIVCILIAGILYKISIIECTIRKMNSPIIDIAPIGGKIFCIGFKI